MFDFDVYGEPVAKGRPRFFGTHAVTPERTRTQEELVASEFLRHYPQAQPLKGEVMMTIVFYKSSHGKPDLDNLEKLVKDALNGLAYTDDQQIKLTLCAMLDPDRMALGKRVIGLVKRRQGMPLTYGGIEYEPHTGIHIEPLGGTIHDGIRHATESMKGLLHDAGNDARYR